MKNNRLKIYLVVALLLVMGVGYAYLNQNIELDNSVTISSYEKPGVPAPTPVNITIVSGEQGNLQPGDKIRIGESEDFYVLSSDNSQNGKTVLLAKYNLLVGNIIEEDEIVGTISSTTEGYGLQSSEARGNFNIDILTYKGTVAFSDTKYWSNNYEYVYDSNSNIYQYISGENGYVNKLKTMGAPSTITGRLLTYEEANNAKTVEDEGNSIIFDEYQSYWLGTSGKNNSVYDVAPWRKNATQSEYDDDTVNGVRPVIEINTSDI